MSLKLGTVNIAGINRFQTNAGWNLFDCKFSDHILNNIQWLRADTFSWQSGSVFVSAYNHLVTDISGITAETETIGSYTVTFYRATDGHKICLADQETIVNNIYTESGIAWYYILDTTNTRFKLPRTKWGFKGLRDNVGDDVEQDVLLPNISGTVTTNTGGSAGILEMSNQGSSTSALYANVVSHYFNGADSTTPNALASLNFDASRSSSVYSGDGTNTNIQERATQMYLYFYVGEYAQSAIEQTAGITSEQLNAKVDKSGLVEVNPMITSYVSGTSGYNIWANGYCEQWGYTYISSAGQTVSLLKTMADANYNCTSAGGTSSYGNTCMYGQTTTSFQAWTSDGSSFNAGYLYWKVSGYLADEEY